MAAWDNPIQYQRDLERQLSEMRAVIAEVIRDGDRHGGRASVKPLRKFLKE